jgi:hypothetical protein
VSATIIRAATLRTVAQSGQHAPGMSDELNYTLFRESVHNDAGHTAFAARASNRVNQPFSVNRFISFSRFLRTSWTSR